MVEKAPRVSKDTHNQPEPSKTCPRCGMEDALDIVYGRCWDCRVAEEEADWMVEDEDEGGSPWGR